MSDLRKKMLALAGNLERLVVTVPELGEVTVRELDGHARGAIETEMLKKEKSAWKLMLVARSVIDPANGQVLFDDADMEALGKLPARVLDPIFEAAFRLSRMGSDAIDEAKGN